MDLIREDLRAAIMVGLSLLLSACGRPSPEALVKPSATASVAAISSEPPAPASSGQATICPDGRPQIVPVPCPGKDLWDALHCPGRECREGTVWNGKACVPPCGALDGGR